MVFCLVVSRGTILSWAARSLKIRVHHSQPERGLTGVLERGHGNKPCWRFMSIRSSENTNGMCFNFSSYTKMFFLRRSVFPLQFSP